MKTEDKNAILIVSLVLGALVFAVYGLCTVVAKEKQRLHEAQVARQNAINTFYANNNCVPHSYVAGNYGPIRVYNCDGVLYTVADMQ